MDSLQESPEPGRVVPGSRRQRPGVDRLVLAAALGRQVELPEVSLLRGRGVRPYRVPAAPPPQAEAGRVYGYVLLSSSSKIFLNLSTMASLTSASVSRPIREAAEWMLDLLGALLSPSSLRRGRARAIPRVITKLVVRATHKPSG